MTLETRASKSTAKSLKPLAARIKKMMQSSDDVGKIAQANTTSDRSISLVARDTLLYKGLHSLITSGFGEARAMEVFVERISKGSATLATAKESKTVTSTHLYVSRIFFVTGKARKLECCGCPQQVEQSGQTCKACSFQFGTIGL